MLPVPQQHVFNRVPALLLLAHLSAGALYILLGWLLSALGAPPTAQCPAVPAATSAGVAAGRTLAMATPQESPRS